MKKTTKLLALILALIMSVTCFASCNGDDVVTDVPDETETLETPKAPEISYAEKTYNTYSENGDYFFSTTEIPTFNTLPAKEITGIRLSSLNSKFSFSANCEGDVKLYAWTAGVSSDDSAVMIKITVDGANEKTVKWVSPGINIPIANGLAKGEHTFTIEKVSGGANLYIASATICGEMLEAPALAIEKGVWVEVFAPESADDEFSSFNVYTQTTHPSGEYFIRYRFIYEYNEVDESLTWSTGSDTGANRSNFRIRTAQIVKKSGSGFLAIHQILQSGEISLAIREINRETGKTAGDFVGGFHGDENLKNARLILDGVTPIELYGGKPGLYNCTSVEFIQRSIINRCHTTFDNVMNHNQHYLIDTNGIRLNQQVEWIKGDFSPNPANTYLQMFTLNRLNPEKAGDYLTTHVNLLDEDGVTLSSVDIRTIDPGERTGVSAARSQNARYAEYSGTEKGIYAKVGFQFIDGSCKLYDANISVRKFGDCKWYPSFIGDDPTPAAGDVWNVNCFYYIDYNPA